MDLKELENLYVKGTDLQEIARRFNVRAQKVRKALLNMGYEVHLRRGIKDIDPAQVRAWVEEGRSVKEISLALRMSQSTLRLLMKEHGVSTKGSLSLPPKEVLEKELATEGGLKGLHEKYGMKYASFRRAVLKLGIKPTGNLRSPHPGKGRADNIEDDDIVREYLEGMTLRALGKKYGLSRQTIANRLEAKDVERRSKGFPSHAQRKHTYDYELALKLHAQGMTTSEIAGQIKTSNQNIYKLLRSRDLNPNVKSKKEVRDVEKLWELYQTKGLREIGLIVGLSAMTVRRLLIEAGYKTRSRGGKIES